MLNMGDRLQILELGYWMLQPGGRLQAARCLTLATKKIDNKSLQHFNRYSRLMLPREALLVRRRRHNMWRGLAQIALRFRRLPLKYRVKQKML